MKNNIKRYRADKKFSIANTPTEDFAGLPASKAEREQWVLDHSPEMDELQNRFYASGKHKMLILLQGMDTSGKDGTVRHVFHAVDPLGIRVQGFKAPSAEELSHDYLWRIHKAMPSTGEIAIFNRSHYEDVLVTYVRGWIDDAELQRRLRQINDFERMLTENGTILLKFFLHISKDEQKERLQKRLDNAKKHWKFNMSDLEDRKMWDPFQKQYQTVIRATSGDNAPWYIVPADSKSGRNVIVMQIILEHLRALNLDYPHVDTTGWPTEVE
ncbi:MAG: polyphosphate kinase 2 family protein [Neisseria sp.]|nr:polyphosphate kinase 2 family protein [Neisseria sp.]